MFLLVCNCKRKSNVQTQSSYPFLWSQLLVLLYADDIRNPFKKIKIKITSSVQIARLYFSSLFCFKDCSDFVKFWALNKEQSKHCIAQQPCTFGKPVSTEWDYSLPSQSVFCLFFNDFWSTCTWDDDETDKGAPKKTEMMQYCKCKKITPWYG